MRIDVPLPILKLSFDKQQEILKVSSFRRPCRAPIIRIGRLTLIRASLQRVDRGAPDPEADQAGNAEDDDLQILEAPDLVPAPGPEAPSEAGVTEEATRAKSPTWALSSPPSPQPQVRV